MYVKMEVVCSRPTTKTSKLQVLNVRDMKSDLYDLTQEMITKTS